jgi:glucose-6-phosphate 1-epimerase
LRIVMTLSPSVCLVEEPNDYPVLVVDHPAVSGWIALNGAHVMEWIPSGHAPVLYMSPTALLERGKAIRGGIPVCWPWFGPQADAAKPMHGFARTSLWEIDRSDEDANGVGIVLRLADSAETRALWPHAFELRLHVSMGADLQVTLHAANTDDAPWSMTGALHTYLKVGDVREVGVHGLHGTQYVESRLSPEKRPQHGCVVFDQEVDRLYASDATLVVRDPALAREIIVEKAGSLATVVWNPWIEKSKRLADLPDEAYPDFLCIEAANAGEDVVTVQPGAAHRLAQRISVRRL